MTHLLVFREHLQKIYQKYASVLAPCFRMMLAFFVFSAVNKIIGYQEALKEFYVVGILSVLGGFMPAGILLFAVAVFVVIHLAYASVVIALIVGVIFLTMYFIYFKFAPKHAYAVLAIPAAFPFHLVYGIPVYLGLTMTPVAVIPITCGVGVYYLIKTVTSIISTTTETNINLYHVMLQQYFEEKEMYAVMIAFSMVMLVVYILRKRPWNYAYEIAIVAGTVLNAILLLIVNYLFRTDINMVAFFVGCVLSAVIVWLVQFLQLALNYADVENLQFEDEEYVYYVRAVPKLSISAPSKQIQTFNTREDAGEDKHETGIEEE